MKFDKSPQWLIQLFDALQPEVGGERRLMFGYPAAFTNGQLFTGLFGDQLFVRVDESDGAELTRAGGKPMVVMGRTSKASLVLPASMLEDEEATRSWMRRAHAHAKTLPPKAKAKTKAKAAPAAKPAAKAKSAAKPKKER
jgi:TfoX/Sxy family transcriptional regulator of competence genes